MTARTQAERIAAAQRVCNDLDTRDYDCLGSIDLELSVEKATTAITDLLALIAEKDAALRLHKAWADSEDSGPDYGGQTRDTHPDGERIWRQWWDANLDLCKRAQDATNAALGETP